jgi:hypothetical protein
MNTVHDLTLRDINLKMVKAIDGVYAALDEYREANDAWVSAEYEYRRARADVLDGIEGRTADERDARTFKKTKDEWFEAHRYEVLKDSAKEALRANEAVLSGLQSVAAAHKAEAQLAKYEPREMAG